MRWVAYMAGLRRRTRKRAALIEGAAEYPGDNAPTRGSRSCSSTTASGATTRRSRARAAARAVPAQPAALARNGRDAAARRPARGRESVPDRGIDRLPGDTRPRMFGEEALWYSKRGTARAVIGPDRPRRPAIFKRRWPPKAGAGSTAARVSNSDVSPSRQAVGRRPRRS